MAQKKRNKVAVTKQAERNDEFYVIMRDDNFLLNESDYDDSTYSSEYAGIWSSKEAAEDAISIEIDNVRDNHAVGDDNIVLKLMKFTPEVVCEYNVKDSILEESIDELLVKLFGPKGPGKANDQKLRAMLREFKTGV